MPATSADALAKKRAANALKQKDRDAKRRKKNDAEVGGASPSADISGDSRRQQAHACDPRANAAPASFSTGAPGSPPPEPQTSAMAAQEEEQAPAVPAGSSTGAPGSPPPEPQTSAMAAQEEEQAPAVPAAQARDAGMGTHEEEPFTSRRIPDDPNADVTMTSMSANIDALKSEVRALKETIVKTESERAEQERERAEQVRALTETIEKMERERADRVKGAKLTMRAGVERCSPDVCVKRPHWNTIIRAFFPDARETLDDEQERLQETLSSYRSWLADQRCHSKDTIEDHSLGMSRLMWCLSMSTAPGEAELLGLRDRDLVTKLQTLPILAPNLEWTRGVWEGLHFYIDRHLDREGVHAEVRLELQEVQRKLTVYRKIFISKKEEKKKFYDRQDRDQGQAALMKNTFGAQERRQVAVCAMKTLKYLAEREDFRGKGLENPAVGKASNAALATVIHLRTIPLRQGPWMNLTWRKF